MANKKTKSASSVKKTTNAKQAFKKKQKTATRSRTDQLREDLDCQMQAVYLMQQALPQSKNIPTGIDSPRVDSVNDLLTSITKL